MSAFQVRARFNHDLVTVYQGHRPDVAEASVAAGRLILPRRSAGNLWITTAFLDAMRDSEWAMKEGQHRILALNLQREGFEWILANAAPGVFDPQRYGTQAQWERAVAHSPVRIQWDQAIAVTGEPAGWLSIRLGLALDARKRFLAEFITGIEDVTPHVWSIHQLVLDGHVEDAASRLPQEHPYPLRNSLREHLGMVA